MDWLIDRQHPESTERVLSLLDDHLRRHAASQSGVDKAVEAVRDVLGQVRDGSDLMRLHLDWRADRARVVVSPVHEAVDGIRPGAGLRARDAVRLDTVTGDAVTRVPLEIQRRAQETYAEGPPPMGAIDADPRRDGMASVANDARAEPVATGCRCFSDRSNFGEPPDCELVGSGGIPADGCFPRGVCLRGVIKIQSAARTDAQFNRVVRTRCARNGNYIFPETVFDANGLHGALHFA